MTKINIGIGQVLLEMPFIKNLKIFQSFNFDIDETKCNSSFENLVNNSNYIFVPTNSYES